MNTGPNVGGMSCSSRQKNLYWNLVESQFSVTLNLKKSFIKNKDGRSGTSGLHFQNDRSVGELLSLRNKNQTFMRQESNAKLATDNLLTINQLNDDFKKTKSEIAGASSAKHDLNKKHLERSL